MGEEVQKIGRVTYIDPNKMYMGQNSTDIPNAYEDYCMSVDLEIYETDRDACGEPEDKITKYSSGNGTISFMSGTDGSLTTNYTDISAVDPTNNTHECLGIESITVSYETWMYPIVNIKFIDVRGGSLLSQSEFDLRNGGDEDKKTSFYKAFFKFPYPLFKLKVKGFYGKEVTYNLALQNFNTEFNCQTGNFEIMTAFKGYMYGIYTDIPMSYLAIAPYIGVKDSGSKYGEYWTNKKNDGTFSYVSENGTAASEMFTYPELKEKMSIADRLNDEETQKTTAAKNLSELKEMMEEINELDSKFPFNKTENNWYIAPDTKEKNKYHYYHIVEKPNYIATEKLSLTFPVEAYDNFKGMAEKLIVNKPSYKTVLNTIIAEFDKKEKDYYELEANRGNLAYSDGTYSIKLRYWEPSYVLKNENGWTIINSTETIETIGEKYPKINLKTNNNVICIYDVVIGADFDKFISDNKTKYEKTITNLEKGIADYKTANIKNVLGFKPSIENVFRMSFAHMNTFINEYYNCLKGIKDSERTFDSCGIKKEQTEYANSKRRSSDFLPPFPDFITQDNENNVKKTTIRWVGDVIGDENANNLEEVKLVNKILDASKLYSSKMKDVEQAIESYKSDEKCVELDKYIPILPYEYYKLNQMNNPYASYNINGSSEELRDNLMSILGLRCFNAFYGLGEANKFIGRMEAYNFKKAIPSITYDFYDKVIKKNDKEGLKKYIEDNSAKCSWKIFSGDTNIGNGKTIKKTDTFVTEKLDDYKWLLINDGTTNKKYLPVGEFMPLTIKEEITNGSIEENEKYIELTASGKNLNSFHIIEDINAITAVYDELQAKMKEDGEFEKYINDKTIRKFISNNSLLTTEINVKAADNYYASGVLKFKEGGKNAKYEDLKNGENVIVAEPTRIGKFTGSNIFDGDTGTSIFGTEIYYRQNMREAKAYLFLMSIPMWLNGEVRIIPKANRYTSELKLMLLREGAYYWRYDLMESGEDDPIIYDSTYKTMAKDEVPIYNTNNNGFIISTSKRDKYTKVTEPINNTTSRRNYLKRYFEDWAIDEYVNLIEPKLVLRNESGKTISYSELSGETSYFREYNPTYSTIGKYNSAQKCRVGMSINGDSDIHKDVLCPLYSSEITTIDLVLRPRFSSSIEEKCDYKSYYGGFISQIKKLYADQIAQFEDNVSVSSYASDSTNTSDAKLSIYMTLKTLYDRWLCNRKKTTWDYAINLNNCTDSDFKNVIYLDSFYHKIGSIFECNMSKIANTMAAYIPTSDSIKPVLGERNNEGRSLYSFWSQLCEEHQLLFIAMPNMFGEREKGEFEEMFKPIPYNSIGRDDTTTYLCMYTYKPSQYLDTGDSDYPDDGLQITDAYGNLITIDSSLSDEGENILAFGVSFGTQNQSYFKSIQLKTTNNPQTTEHAIAATMQIAAKGSSDNAANTPTNAQDLYDVYSNYSYQCTVTMMGDAQIMPYMYFQLTNIPLWRGTYVITHVEHNISAGKMETTFTGVRVNKYALQLYKGDQLIIENLDNVLNDAQKFVEDYYTIDNYTGTLPWSSNTIFTSITPFIHTSRKIKNVPTSTEEKHIFELAQTLEKIVIGWTAYCAKMGISGESGITITSGFRGEQLNTAVGGASTSAHKYGYAIDMHPNNGQTQKMAQFIYDFCNDSNNGIKFDQILCEFTESSRWIHFGLRNGAQEQRGQYCANYDASKNSSPHGDFIKASWA